jgi:hypothetical protein
LFVPPVVGLANNGDFGKVTGVFGLGADGRDEFKYAPIHYTFARAYKFDMEYRSSEQLLAAAAIGLNRMVRRDGDFDVRAIGFVHGALVLIAFVLIPRRGLVATLCMLLIFGDVLYVSALNSFYMDTAAYVFLLLAVVFYLRGQGWWVVAASLLLVASKTPHALLGIPLAGLLMYERTALGLSGWKARFAAAAMIAGVLLAWITIPRDYRTNSVFSVIFFRILPGSQDVSGDLRLLGLDDSYKRYTGQHAFTFHGAFDEPGFRQEFEKRISYLNLGRFYLRRPGRSWQDFRKSLAEAGSQRPDLGNFDRKYGRPEFSQSRRFAWWSDLKTWMFQGNGGTYLAAILLLTAAALALAMGDRAYLAGVITLVALMYVELLGSALGDALEVKRHFFLFHALEDLLVVATVGLAARRITRASA